MGLLIYANIDATTLNTARVQSATDLRTKTFKPMAAGDSTVVDLFLTGQTGLQNIQDYPTVRLGIGSLNARPTAGTWDLGAQTGLAYDISAAALDTAITAEVAACTVTSITSFVYKVVFTANGAQTIPAVDATGLTPSSTVSITRLVTGDGSTQEEWLIRIFQNPIALIDGGWSNISGSGIRGSLNLGTEGIYELLGTSTSASTTIELELTDANGDIQTIFQMPLTITGEVVGQGVTGVATFDSYVTSSVLTAGMTKNNMIFVSKNGSDSSGTRNRFDLPFLTCTAALAAASSGDLIMVFPGDYSAESALAGADNVNWEFKKGSTSPAFSISGAFTFTINGDTGSYVFTSNASASITINGTVGTYIAASAGSITANGCNQRIDCSGGTVTLKNANYSYDGTFRTPVFISSSGSVNLYNSRIESTESGGEVIQFEVNWSGSLFANNCDLIATTVTGNEATNGLLYSTGVTGSVQLKNCTIITTATGTGTAKSIDAPSAQTVYIQGSLNATHDISATVTTDGGNLIINSAFTA